MRKIFQIGFNKCGTRSLTELFEANSVPSVHYDNARIAPRMARRIKNGEDPVADYPDTLFFSDLEKLNRNTHIEIYRSFKVLFEHYPSALFVLNNRDLERWLESRLNQGDGSYLERYRICHGLNTTDEVVDAWVKLRRTHHDEVREFFADKPNQLIEFNIETAEVADLCRFVVHDYTLDPGLYPLVGKKNLGVAIKRAQSVVAKPDATPDDWMTLGDLLITKGRLNEAETAYTRCLGLDERSAIAHRRLAVIAQRTGRSGVAVGHTLRAAELGSAPGYHLYLAGLLAEAGSLAAAAQTLRVAESFGGQTPQILHMRSVIVAGEGDSATAVDLARAAFDACPHRRYRKHLRRLRRNARAKDENSPKVAVSPAAVQADIREVPHPLEGSFVTCTLLRASVAETRAFVRHHLELGAARMWIFFDDPEDPGLDMLEEFECVTPVACDSEHWERLGGRPEVVPDRQGVIADLAMGWAAAEGIDWFVHLDSDEFLDRPKTPLLSVPQADVFVLPPFEIVPVLDSGGFAGPRYFKVPNADRLVGSRRIAALPGAGQRGQDLRSRLRKFRREFGPERSNRFRFNGYRAGKSAIRVSLDLYSSVRLHSPEPRPGVSLEVGLAAGCSVLHFDGHDFESWRQKWLERVAGVRVHARGGPRRGRQLEDFREALDQGGESGLENYFVERFLPTQGELDVAEELGLVRRIDQPVLKVE